MSKTQIQPHTITLSFNNMHFLVLNLFGHDITHDAHPFGIGEGRLIKAFASLGGFGGGGGENNSMKGGADIINELEVSSTNTTTSAITDLIYDSTHKYCLYLLSAGDGMRRNMNTHDPDIALNHYTNEVNTTVIIDTGEIDRLLKLINGTLSSIPDDGSNYKSYFGTICNYMYDNKFGYFKNIYINGIVFEPINIVVQYALDMTNGKAIRLTLNKKPSIDSDFYAIYEIIFYVYYGIHFCNIQTIDSYNNRLNSSYTLVSTSVDNAIRDRVSLLYTCKLENIENWEKIQTLNVIEPNYETKNLLMQLLKSCEGQLIIDTSIRLTLFDAIQQLFIVSTYDEFYQKYQTIITAITQPPFTSMLPNQYEVIDILIDYIVDSKKVGKDVMDDWKRFLITIVENEQLNMEDTNHFNYYYFASGLLLKLNSSSLDEPIDAEDPAANTHRSGGGQHGGQIPQAQLLPPLTYKPIGTGTRIKYTIHYPYDSLINPIPLQRRNPTDPTSFVYNNIIFGINFDIDKVKNAISEFMKIYKYDVLFDDSSEQVYFDTILTYKTPVPPPLSEELDYNNSIISVIDDILSKNLSSSNIATFKSYIQSIMTTTIHGRIKTIQKKFGLKYKKLIILFEEFENMLTYQIRYFCLYIINTPLTNPPPVTVIIPVPIVDDPFLENFRKNVIVYIDILNFINGFNTPDGIKLTAEQKNVGSSVVCASVKSITTELDIMIKSLQVARGYVLPKKDSILLNGQKLLLSKLLLEANIKKGSTGSGNIDEKIEAFFLQYIQAGPGGLGNFEGNANYKLGVIPSGSSLFNELGYNPGTGKYFINNFVSSIKQVLPDVPSFFCPISSLVDGQPTCSSKTQAEVNNGVEYGDMNVIIKDVDGNMIYHIKTKRTSSSVYEIAAKLILNGKTIVDLKESVDINKPRDSPLSAVKVLIKMIQTNKTNYDTLQSKSWMSYLYHLGLSGPAEDSMRKNILEVSIIKSLGDFLQELNTVTVNSGYIDQVTRDPKFGIVDPKNARLGLNNDRPAAVLSMLLTLAGKTGINAQAVTGFLGPYDKKSGVTRYFIANRNKKFQSRDDFSAISAPVAGGKTRRNKRNKNRKTKRNKRNKKRKTINKKRKTRKRFSPKK
jgi:hypothetical protein